MKKIDTRGKYHGSHCTPVGLLSFGRDKALLKQAKEMVSKCRFTIRAGTNLNSRSSQHARGSSTGSTKKTIMHHHYFDRLRSTFGAVDRRADLGDYVFDRLSHLFPCLFLYRIHLYRLCPSRLWACPWIFLSPLAGLSRTGREDFGWEVRVCKLSLGCSLSGAEDSITDPVNPTGAGPPGDRPRLSAASAAQIGLPLFGAPGLHSLSFLGLLRCGTDSSSILRIDRFSARTR